MSKYSHHSPAATTTPSTAATTTPAPTSAPTPAPIATIDSPSAMITISPWRSEKWAGMSFQPSAPNRYGPPMSSAIASTHNPPCRGPSANDAAVSSPVSSNTCGTQSAATRSAAIAAKMASRTTPSSGSTRLVSQA